MTVVNLTVDSPETSGRSGKWEGMDNTYTADRQGMIWSISMIVLTIAIVGGVIQYIEGRPVVEYKIESALQDLEQRVFLRQPVESFSSVHTGSIPAGYIKPIGLE